MEEMEQKKDCHPVDLSRVLLNDEGRISEDLVCLGCGYNLRTLLLHADCPECGMAVDLSVRGDFLRFARSKWVRRVSLGMNCIWVSAVLALLLFCSTVLFFFLAISLNVGSGVNQPVMIFAERFVPVFASIIASVAFVLLVTGVFMATCFEQNSLTEENSASFRLIARCFIVAAAMMTLFWFVIAQFQQWEMMAAAFFIQVIAWFGFLFSMLAYLRKMALRIPDSSLARQTSIVMWGWGALLVMVIPAGVSGLFFLPFLLGISVFAAWLLVLVDKYKKAFAAAAVHARDHAQQALQDIELS